MEGVWESGEAEVDEEEVVGVEVEVVPDGAGVVVGGSSAVCVGVEVTS